MPGTEKQNQPLTISLDSLSYMRPAYVAPSAWTEHVPFAFWLTETLRPNNFVELGTHWGVSYFAFCQAIEKLGLDTQAYAVDTWLGDEHAGHYGNEVYKAVKDHNDGRYAQFSTLLRQEFNQAADYFLDGSIDLLHIDGLHTYEAVAHDFNTWLPKMSDRGVVVFHDTNVRDRNFGVFRLFSELRETYPTFEFIHGHGLGIVGIGEHQPAGLKRLFAAEGDYRQRRNIHAVFSSLGRSCLHAYQNQALDQKQSRVKQLEAEAAKSREAAQQAEQKIAALAADLQKRAGEVQAATQARGGAEARVKQLEADAAQSREAAQAAERVRVGEEGRRAALKELAAEREVYVRRLEDDLAALREKGESAERRLVDLEALHEERASAVQAAETEAEALRGRLSEVQSALAQRQHETEQTALELADLRRRQAFSAEAQAEADKIAQSLNDHIALLMAEVKERQAAFAALETRHLAQLEATEHARSAASETSEALRRAQAEAEAAKAEVEASRLAQADLRKAKDDLDARLKERFDEIAVLTGMLAKKEAEAAGALEALTQAKAEGDAALKRTREEAREAKAEVEQAKAAAAQARGAASETAEALRRVQAEVEAAKAEIDVSRRSQADLRQGKDAAEARLKERFDEIAILTRMLAEKEAEAARLRDESEKARGEAPRTGADAAGLRSAAGRELGRAILKVIELPPVWSLLPRERRLKRQMELLRQSGLFDAQWYLDRHVDIARAGVDPARHYIEYGAREGREPGRALEQASRPKPSSSK